MNKRRRLVIAIGASALTTALDLFAQQQGKVWQVGFLYFGSRQSALDLGRYQQFQQGMRELGYEEGRNFSIVARFADGKRENVPRLAAELVQLKVDVIVTGGAQNIDAARKATSTIPIVMATAPDPVVSGFAKTLARPGGNITGLTNFTVDLSPKLFEMLQSMVPKLSRLAVMMNPDNSSHAGVLQSVESSAQKAGVKVLPVEARNAAQIEQAFSAMVQAKAGGVLVPRDGFFVQQVGQIANLAKQASAAIHIRI